MKVFFMCKLFYLLHSQLVIEDVLRCVGASLLFDHKFHRREIGVFEVYKFTMFFCHVQRETSFCDCLLPCPHKVVIPK